MAKRLSHRRYLLLWAILAGGCMVLVAAVNFVIDPYDIHGLLNKAGLNQIKPHAGANGAMAKAYQVLRAKPQTLVLGNSRAEVGFNPQSTAWPQGMRPVFNLALPGTGPIASLRYLQHALSVHKPTTVVLGVDFMDFLVSEDDSRPRTVSGPSSMEQRLLVTPAGGPNPGRWRQRVEDFAASVLSLDASLHSIGTVAAQRGPYPAHLTSQGFNPMRDYERIARDEGYYAMFWQRDQENALAYWRRPKAIYQRGTATSPQFDVLRRMIGLCREQGVEMHLVIYPYHAHLLETFYSLGLWPQFEEWKRALARLAAEAGRDLHAPVVRLWDFSGYNAISAERVPDAEDRKTGTRWYWEAGHFKQELGDVMLRRMFAAPSASDPAIGVQLAMDNMEQATERLRQERAWYERSHASEVAAIRGLIRQVTAGRAPAQGASTRP